MGDANIELSGDAKAISALEWAVRCTSTNAHRAINKTAFFSHQVRCWLPAQWMVVH